MEALLTTVGKREACAKVRTHSVDEWMHACPLCCATPDVTS